MILACLGGHSVNTLNLTVERRGRDLWCFFFQGEVIFSLGSLLVSDGTCKHGAVLGQRVTSSLFPQWLIKMKACSLLKKINTVGSE